MSFWTSPNLHPKTKSRFIVSFGTRFFLPNVMNVTKPAVEVATKEYRLMNHYFNYPGLVRWQPIKITFIDMNGTGGHFDTAQMLYEMLNNSGYAPPNVDSKGHRIGKNKNSTLTPITTPEKASTIANSFGDGLWDTTNKDPSAPNANNRTIRIQQIDFGSLSPDKGKNANEGNFIPDANTVEQWELINPIITNISWGDLDYSSDNFVEYTLDIKYDWAEFKNDVDSDIELPLITNKYQEFSR